MIIGTLVVNKDEKAFGLEEIHRQSPNSKGFHRYQVIHVDRNGKIAEFVTDLGLASKFKGVNTIFIPSFWEHTVGELQDMADELRGQVGLDIKDFLSLDNYKPA